MESVDLLAKQKNEIGPKTVPEGGTARSCFVCSKPVEIGQQYYYIQCGNYTRRRHITCMRKTAGKDSGKVAKQEIPLAVGRIIRGTNSIG